jgi:hypothetical protein
MLRALWHINSFEGLFDKAFYLRKYPDLALAKVKLLRHYVKYGAAEGRKPHPLFEPDYYLRRYPEVRGSGNPLAHFLEHGGKRGMSPHPLFDCEAYLQANSGAAARGIHPLVHYVARRRSSGTKSGGTEGSQFGCAS